VNRRALRPFLHGAKQATVVVVTDEHPTEEEAIIGADAVNHLKHQVIDAVLHRVKGRRGDVAAKLIAEAEGLKADLIVMGGYGHLRLRERRWGNLQSYPRGTGSAADGSLNAAWTDASKCRGSIVARRSRCFHSLRRLASTGAPFALSRAAQPRRVNSLICTDSSQSPDARWSVTMDTTELEYADPLLAVHADVVSGAASEINCHATCIGAAIIDHYGD
jgi:hypothetical protein